MRGLSRRIAIASSAALGLAGAARAEGLDATQPLVCALAEASECDGVAKCADVAVADIDLPPALRVDFAAKQLVSEDGARTSPIAAVETLEAVVVLQGHQNGRGWTMVIERATGHLSAAVADAEGSFALAGACTRK
jgi:hypothetical protein